MKLPAAQMPVAKKTTKFTETIPQMTKEALYVPEDLYRMIKETKYCTALNVLLFLRQLLVIRSPIVRSDHVDEIAH